VILTDTSVWVDHLRRGEPHLTRLLEADQVLVHPFVVGELALGGLSQGDVVVELLSNLPAAISATDAEVLDFIRSQGLAGLGVGYVDAHLLASTVLTPDARLWTRDGKLAAAARRLNVGAFES
jgi:predicted nucleic acid-binding protein